MLHRTNIARALFIALTTLTLATAASASNSFSWPSSITFNGGQIVLDIFEDNNTAGVVIEVDYDDDTTGDVSVTTDNEGRATLSLDYTFVASGDIDVRSDDGGGWTSWSSISITQNSSSARSNNLLSPDYNNVQPQPCTCSTNCGSNPYSPEMFTSSFEASAYGVTLADGAHKASFSILGFQTRKLGFGLTLHHHSMNLYNGPYGNSVSHTYDMHVVRTTTTDILFVTPDLRQFVSTYDSGDDWHYISGFLGTIKRDTALQRWIFTHHTGSVFEFLMTAMKDVPGRLVRIHEPNGNRTLCRLDVSGYLEKVVTDLNQEVTFGYNSSGQCTSVTDPLSRTFTLSYDGNGNLTDISHPASTYVNVSSGTLNTTDSLTTTSGARTYTLYYADANNPDHITKVTDPRGATMYEVEYDASNGRADVKTINGNDVTFTYDDVLFTGTSPNTVSPVNALAKVESGNITTRVTDRMGNIADYEMHSDAAGPMLVNGAYKGRWGLRRLIQWTETGKGNTALRGSEPSYYEKRWLYDCNCLAAHMETDWWTSADVGGLTMDAYDIPTDWPRIKKVYNDNSLRRQVIEFYRYGPSGEEIKWTKTYQDFDPGTFKFSRELTFTPPQEYDSNAIYTSMDFTHTYTYDNQGNRLTHVYPTVTRGLGVGGGQTATDTWTYNGYGQVATFTDANGNKSLYEYHSAATSPAYTINEANTYEGYLFRVTRGYTGSSDTVVNLTSEQLVNAVGMVTESEDGLGQTFTTEYYTSGQVKETETPTVTFKGTNAALNTKYFYDRAGYRIRVSRENLDATGSARSNAWIDTSWSFDDVGNNLKMNVEVDNTDGNDLVTEYLYNDNDQVIVSVQPEGNRSFTTYDERSMPFRTFYGISASGTTHDAGYPAATATTLSGPTFVGYTETTYDANGNVVASRDGRGEISTFFYDFANRRTASRDPNGNGTVVTYDEAGQVLHTESGVVTSGGAIYTLYSRSYTRYDERGRAYQNTVDGEIGTDETSDIDPCDGDNSCSKRSFDKVNRVLTQVSGRGDTIATHAYDAANRKLYTDDAYLNRVSYTYDGNSNVTQITELEKAGPGASGSDETYVTMFEYDELNRRKRTRVRGLETSGPSYAVDHSSYSYFDASGFTQFTQDAEGNWSSAERDDLGRTTRVERWDGDPTGSPSRLMRSDTVYDDNSRVIEVKAYPNMASLGTVQTTKYAYDDLNRRNRTVYPDSDDPIDGSGNGTDTTFDRIEVVYDANSNVTSVTEQRGVVIANVYDDANRLTQQNVTLAGAVAGETKREFAYDAVNRLTTADNDFARVQRTYDDYSRLVQETQSIRLDGTGFDNDWEDAVNVVSSLYDRDSNRGRMVVEEVGGGSESLRVNSSFDEMSRVDDIDTEYFGSMEAHAVASFTYFGNRLQKKTLGNGVYLEVGYDGKRRVNDYTWRDDTMAHDVLVGFTYDYDDVNNPLWEKFKHDNDYYTSYRYDDMYRLTGVRYRDASSIDYRSYGGSWAPGGGNYGAFSYDALGNRTSTTDGDPFGTSSMAATVDSYTINAANEYTQINRDSTNMNPSYDAAGNMVSFPTRPGAGTEAGNDVSADAVYDAFNQALEIQAGSNQRHHYRYDALGRRIAAYERGTTASTPGGWTTPGGYQNYNIDLGRRYIIDGSRIVAERMFDAGATLAEAPTTLERVHVGSALFTAVDANLDGAAAANSIDMSVNHGASAGLVAPAQDVSFYYYTNAFGRVAAYASKHDDEVVYEFLVHRAFGEVVYLPVLDDGTGGGTASDNKEDTDTTLTDNNTQALSIQGTNAVARRASLAGGTWVAGAWRGSAVAGTAINGRSLMTATIAALSSRGERGLGMPLPWEIVPGGIVVVGPPDIEYINIDSIDGVKDSDRRYRDPRDWPIYAETTRCKWKHIYIKVYNCCPDVEDPSDFSDTPKTQSAEKGLDERISKVFEQCCIVVHYELVKPSSDDCSTYKDFENLPAHDKGTTCYATLTLQERSAYTKKGDDVTGEGGRDAKGNRKGMAFCDRGVNVTTAAHEIGHAFELWHERTDGKKREPQDIMNETNDKGPDGRGMGSVKQFKFAEEDCKTLRSKACDK